jgi:hypothetical protein
MPNRVFTEAPIPTSVASAVRLLADRIRPHRDELELDVQLRQALAPAVEDAAPAGQL